MLKIFKKHREQIKKKRKWYSMKEDFKYPSPARLSGDLSHKGRGEEFFRFKSH